MFLPFNVSARRSKKSTGSTSTTQCSSRPRGREFLYIFFLPMTLTCFLFFFLYHIKYSYFFMQYKFAPDLIMLDAYETVESWMMARNTLNPGKLIPAMMRYVSEPHAKYDMCCTLFLFI
jgi:hypothetical protein